MAELMEALEDWQAGKTLAECNKFMLQNEISSDVTFLLGQSREPVKAHKYILISRSSVFQSIFCAFDTKGDLTNNFIPISDIEPQTFRLLLTYLYTSHVEIKKETVDKVLYAAKKYAVKSLIELCLSFLESIISTDNVCAILEQVHLYEGKDLEHKCISFIYDHAEKALKSVGFERLCSSCVEQIIDSDELVVEENEVFKAVLKWSKKECERRGKQVTDLNQREVLGPLLYKVRFPLLNPVYFTNYVSNRQILNSQEIIAVFQYFHGQERATNWKFSTNPRRGFSLSSVIRYNLIQMEEFECAGKTQAVCFTCSKPIILYGLMMYGGIEESASYEVRIHLLDEEIKKQLSLYNAKIVTDRTVHTYELFYAKPVALEAGKKYRVAMEFEGPPTKVGVHGKENMVVDDVKFHFSTVQGNNTTTERGQIPGLLFMLPEPAEKEVGVESPKRKQ